MKFKEAQMKVCERCGKSGKHKIEFIEGEMFDEWSSREDCMELKCRRCKYVWWIDMEGKAT